MEIALAVLLWVLERVGDVLLMVIAWYTILLFAPGAARSIAEAALRGVEKRERELAERSRRARAR